MARKNATFTARELTRDVVNPTPDRRCKYEARHLPLFPKGTRLAYETWEQDVLGDGTFYPQMRLRVASVAGGTERGIIDKDIPNWDPNQTRNAHPLFAALLDASVEVGQTLVERMKRHDLVDGDLVDYIVTKGLLPFDEAFLTKVDAWAVAKRDAEEAKS